MAFNYTQIHKNMKSNKKWPSLGEFNKFEEDQDDLCKGIKRRLYDHEAGRAPACILTRANAIHYWHSMKEIATYVHGCALEVSTNAGYHLRYRETFTFTKMPNDEVRVELARKSWMR